MTISDIQTIYKVYNYDLVSLILFPHQQNPDDTSGDLDEDIPDSVAQYLERVQHRSEDVEKDLQECDDILQKASQNQRSM